MNKKFYKEEVVMACDWFSDLYTNKRLPSHDCISKWFNEYYVESFPVRNAYVTTFGFPLLTKEVIAEIVSAINSLVHVGGGRSHSTGTLLRFRLFRKSSERERNECYMYR